MKHKIIAIAIFFIALSSCKQQQNLNLQPKLGATPQVKIGKAEKFELPNGLKVVMVENHKLPRVSVSIDIDNKPYFQKDKAGASTFMGALLGTGTKSISKDEFIEKVDFMGASVQFDEYGASVESLKKYFTESMKLLADGILNPVFSQEELDKQIQMAVEGLRSSEKNASEISKRVKSALLYGKEHPYGEFATEQSIKNVSLEDVKYLYETYYKPNNAYMAIVGDIDPVATKKLITDLFKNWKKGEIPASNFDKAKNPNKAEINFVDVPNAVQSIISIVNNTDLTLADDDYYAAMIANNILGGGSSSRLFKNLREDKAYTYGAYSRITADRYGAYFNANASVRNAVTDSAVVEFNKELTKMVNTKPTAEELKLTKAIYTGNFVMNVGKPEMVSKFALNIAKYNLPEDFYEKYLDKINAVTLEDVQKAAKEHFKVDNSRIVIIGKGTEVIPNLEKVGIPIKYFDKYVNVATPVKIEKVAKGVTVESVVNKYFDAIGGVNKVKAVKSIAATLESSMQGMKITSSLKTASPNKMSFTMKSNGQVLQKQVFDGVKGYMEMQGRKIDLPKEEIDIMKLETTPFADFAYLKGTLKGIEEVNDKKAYVIHFSNKKVFYDIESGLKLKEVTAFKDPQSGQEVSVGKTFSDYKTVNGIKFPHIISQEIGPGMNMDMKVINYLINKNISDNDFK